MGEVLILIIYGILMIGMNVFLKRNKDIESYCVSNRQMKTVQSAMGIAASWVWAPSLLVAAERAYVSGVAGLFWFLVPNVLTLLIFIPYAKKIRKEMPKGITLSGYMKEKYDSDGVKKIYLLELTGLAIFSTAVQMLAGGKLLSMLTGLPFLVITLFLAAIVFSYAHFSGIKSSVFAETIQLLVIITIVITFASGTLKTAGIHALINGLSGISGEYGSIFSTKGAEVFFSFGLSSAIGLLAGPFGDQCFWQRAFAIKEKSLGKAFALGALLFALVPLSMGIIGFVAAGTGFIATDNSIVNFEYLVSVFPRWIVIPFLIMFLSGLLARLDSNLSAISSLTTDMYKRSSIKISKVSMILLLFAGILISNIPGLTVTHLFLFYGTLRASTMLPTILTLNKVKLSAKGIIIGVVVSLVVGLPIFAYGNLYNLAQYKTIGSLITVLSSGILALVISRIGRRAEA
ncbi:MAG: sodium:solute symporter family transporter [Lacrimispora sphenoides]